MKTLQELAEEYAQREDLHTEDGEYTKTTIEDAYKAGAIETLKTTILALAMQSRINLDAQMLYVIGDLDTNLRTCCHKITEEKRDTFKQAMEEKISTRYKHSEVKDLAAKVLKIKEEIAIPDNCEVWDDKGNVISTSKIIIREKKTAYPKTYEECCEVLGIGIHGHYALGYESDILSTFQNLIICRNAYWKLYGEEMGLGKPWEPDYTDPDQDRYAIANFMGNIEKSKWDYGYSITFVFPIAEMRDDFKKNFDPDIEMCKELL